jgi:hypothetical protein
VEQFVISLYVADDFFAFLLNFREYRVFSIFMGITITKEEGNEHFPVMALQHIWNAGPVFPLVVFALSMNAIALPGFLMKAFFVLHHYPLHV